MPVKQQYFSRLIFFLQKLSIYGDMEYMKDQKPIPYLQSSLVIIRSPGEEGEQEAGPLPSKVNLDQSNI